MMQTPRKPAPELPIDLAWVNTDAPPRIAALRGRVVLLWFWSGDSIHCWNLVPMLRQLEDRYHDGLAVIGIHCPKYPHHRHASAVLRAVNRLGVRHAVASDDDFRVWQDYAVEAWPTLVMIDVEGRLAAAYAGEGARAQLDARIAELLDEAAMKDLRVFEPTPPAQRREPRGTLLFPGKVLPERDLLYIADSGHHRVLECQHDGRVLRQFGSGDPGHVDGVSAQACFEDPRGLARHNGSLYVADRGNHSVRRIDLADGSVETVLGTGRAGRSRPDGADARATALNSPVDVLAVGDDLFVSVAGQQQVWRLDLPTGRVWVLAGSGEQGLVDGIGVAATFGAPGGLAFAGRQLIVADAQANALRAVSIDDGRVETLAGAGLYEFGDVCGQRGDVRFQHPLAVAVDPRGVIHVADSYNGAIKMMNRRTGETRPLRMPYRLEEPQGLGLCDGQLWIANTNLHEIACIELAAGRLRRVAIGDT